MVSLMPARVVGSGKPELLLPSEVASLLPKTDTMAPGATPPVLLKLAPLTIPAEGTEGGGAALAFTAPLTVARTAGRGGCQKGKVTVGRVGVSGIPRGGI